MPGLKLSRTTRRTDRTDRGVSALVFAILLPVIIGAVGLSVDGGRMAVERSNLRSAADSAALAVGQDCARASRVPPKDVARCTNSGSESTIALATNGNSPGAAGSVGGTLTPASGQTTVTVTKTVPMTLGATIGIKPKGLTASATVTWNQTPVSAATLPLSMDVCDYHQWKSSSTPRLFRYDEVGNARSPHESASSCSHGLGSSIGGSLWLAPKGAEHPAFDEDACMLPTDLSFTADYMIQPHNWNFPDGCARTGLLTAGKTYLVIVGQSSGWDGWGNGRVPTIRGYAPFVVTGWRFGPKQRVEYDGGTVPTLCTLDPSCRGIVGYFTGSVVPLDGALTYENNPDADFGSIRVKITS